MGHYWITLGMDHKLLDIGHPIVLGYPQDPRVTQDPHLIWERGSEDNDNKRGGQWSEKNETRRYRGETCLENFVEFRQKDPLFLTPFGVVRALQNLPMFLLQVDQVLLPCGQLLQQETLNGLWKFVNRMESSALCTTASIWGQIKDNNIHNWFTPWPGRPWTVENYFRVSRSICPEAVMLLNLAFETCEREHKGVCSIGLVSIRYM